MPTSVPIRFLMVLSSILWHTNLCLFRALAFLHPQQCKRIQVNRDDDDGVHELVVTDVNHGSCPDDFKKPYEAVCTVVSKVSLETGTFLHV